MSFILFRANKDVTKPVTHTERYQEDNMIFTRKKIIRAGGEPKHGVIFYTIPSIIEKHGDRSYVMDFKIFWATSFRAGNSVKRKEKYLGRFRAEYNPRLDIAGAVKRYWKLEEELIEAKLNKSPNIMNLATKLVDTTPREIKKFGCQSLIWNIMETIKNPDIESKDLSLDLVRDKLIDYLLDTEARFSMVTNNL